MNKVDLERPHLSNLNQDPQLSRRINYSIDKEKTKIGKRGTEPVNDIEIGGMGIRNLHAVIYKDEDQLCIEPIEEGEDSSCYVNGDAVTKRTELKHYDRLTFGTNNMFVVMIPGGETRDEVDPKTIDWDLAQN